MPKLCIKISGASIPTSVFLFIDPQTGCVFLLCMFKQNRLPFFTNVQFRIEKCNILTVTQQQTTGKCRTFEDRERVRLHDFTAVNNKIAIAELYTADGILFCLDKIATVSRMDSDTGKQEIPDRAACLTYLPSGHNCWHCHFPGTDVLTRERVYCSLSGSPIPMV